LSIYHFLTEWFSDKAYIEAQTSGSTGTPKTIRLQKPAMVNSAKATCAFFGLDATDNALLCLPASYIAGKMMLVRALVSGLDLMVIKPASNPFVNIEKTIDFTAITPHQLYESLGTLARRNIRKIIVGGSAVGYALEHKLQSLPCTIFETYGMTETCSHIALRELNGTGRSDYFALLEGVSIETDKRGCLVIDAPLLTPVKLVTNDVVQIIDDRHFRWLGRFDHVVNSGSVKLYPEQIERTIESILKGSSYFVAGVNDEKLGEKLVLFIEGAPFAMEDLTKLKQTLREVLPPLEIPREIVFIPEFKRSNTGKILKQKVLETIAKTNNKA
ncbi:MAG TPA: AMP-binding protein, partial [Bacteroidales bacterium]|nr:AMP-binding protein [Bacteroidales bacterium]